MKTRLQELLIAGALLASATVPGRAQDAAPSPDPRWVAFLGCWESTGADVEWLCVRSVDESAVEFATVIGGRVVGRERIAVTGERRPSTPDGCDGWESAQWSSQGQRVYFASEYECAGGVRRASTGLLAMLPGSEWVRVHGVIVAGQTAVRVERYRAAAPNAPLPDDVKPAPPLDARAVSDARLAAGAPVGIGDVIEASHHAGGNVLEAWLAERAQAFALNAKQLVALADEKVPDRVIDLMVALSYPRAFEQRVDRRGGGGYPRTGIGRARYAFDPLCYGPYVPSYTWAYDCSPFGYDYHGYGTGWYSNRYPVVIVFQGGGTPSRGHGRLVKDRGYVQGDGGAATQRRAFPRPASGSGGSGSSASGGGSSSSSSSGEQRTAKPRPPQ